MEFDKKVIVDVDGFIEKGKQFDLDLKLPVDDRNVVYGVIKDHHGEPIKDAVVKLVEVCKDERKPVSHTFTDKEGEFVFGPLCPNKSYAIQIWVNQVKHVKICKTCDHEGKCLKGVDLCCEKEPKKEYYKEYEKDEEEYEYYKKHDKKDDKYEYYEEYEKEDKKHEDYKKCDKKDDKYEDYKDYEKEDKKHEDCKKCDKKDDKYEDHKDYEKEDKKHEDCKKCDKKDDKYEDYKDYEKKDKYEDYKY